MFYAVECILLTKNSAFFFIKYVLKCKQSLVAVFSDDAEFCLCRKKGEHLVFNRASSKTTNRKQRSAMYAPGSSIMMFQYCPLADPELWELGEGGACTVYNLFICLIFIHMLTKQINKIFFLSKFTLQPLFVFPTPTPFPLKNFWITCSPDRQLKKIVVNLIFNLYK